ncbi:MAG: hypothetical protein WKF73_22015 [Nocardioidaceae bacterium]
MGELTFDLADLGGTNAGDLLTATVSLENVGESTLIDISAGLDIGRGLAKVGAPKCPSELVGGETAECTVEYTLSQSDVDVGTLATTVTVSGARRDQRRDVAASQQATHRLSPAAAAGLDSRHRRSAIRRPQRPDRGQCGRRTRRTRFTLTNTGAVTLSNLR